MRILGQRLNILPLYQMRYSNHFTTAKNQTTEKNKHSEQKQKQHTKHKDAGSREGSEPDQRSSQRTRLRPSCQMLIALSTSACMSTHDSKQTQKQTTNGSEKQQELEIATVAHYKINRKRKKELGKGGDTGALDITLRL
jgi:hypothetical protein